MTIQKSDLSLMTTKAVDAFKEALTPLPMSKKTRGDLEAGFRDGFRSAIMMLLEAGAIELSGDES